MDQLYLVGETETKAESPVETGYPVETDDDSGVTAFDERFGIRLFGRSYYINLRMGTEKRSGARLDAEGQVPLSGMAISYGAIGSIFLMLFGVLCVLYLLKSGMGINLFSEDSFLHPLFSSGLDSW